MLKYLQVTLIKMCECVNLFFSRYKHNNCLNIINSAKCNNIKTHIKTYNYMSNFGYKIKAMDTRTVHRLLFCFFLFTAQIKIATKKKKIVTLKGNLHTC